MEKWQQQRQRWQVGRAGEGNVDGQWKETYVRVGEAKNPGPAKDAIRATWGAFGAQLPHCGGFRDAVAPGFADPERGAPDGDGKLEPYVLRIATANVTAWSSAITYLHETQADILLVQEHKLGECQADEAVSWLRRRGWNAVMTPAVPGPNGGLSAGTAVLARSHIGLGLPLVGAETVVPGRAVAARIEAPGYRPMTVLSLYLHDGVGLDKTNLEVLRQVGAFLAAQGDSQPFVVGGDMQMPPQEFAHAAFARELGASIAASRDVSGTCRTFHAARELDYFVVKDCMCTGIDAVRTVPRTGIKTHLPVELTFKARMASMRALTIRRPPPLATERIVGPIPHVVDWTDLAEEARTLAADARDENNDTNGIHARLGDIFSRWADAAEIELIEATVDGHSIPKTGLRGKAPVLVWKSVLPERPARHEDRELTMWRNLANNALNLQRIHLDLRGRMMHDGGEGRDDHADHDDACDTMGECGWQEVSLLRVQANASRQDLEELMEQLEGVVYEGGEDTDIVNVIERVMELHDCLITGNDARADIGKAIADARARIGKRLDEVAAETKKRHLDSWATWLRKGIDSGARNAHKYLKVPQQWRPQNVTTPDGVVTAAPEGLVAAYRAKYVKRWNGGAEDGHAEDRPRKDPPWAKEPRCALPRATAAALREASKAFSHGTAVAYDGFAMRHFALITDAGLEVLADVILAMELIGRLPPQLDALVMPMLSKERGGHRAVTTATSLYRLWGRLRREVVQKWESGRDRPYFASGKGRRIHDVIWRQLAKAEAGQANGKVAVGILWDMAAYYETINRTRLWKLVKRHEFPLPVARLAFAAYDAPRALTLEGRIARPAYGRDGVPAGCPFANAFSRLYSIDAFDDLAKEIEEKHGDDSDFDVYVDDLAVTVVADESDVVSIAVATAEALRVQVEQVMGCEIELAKAAVVSSSAGAAAAIVKKLKEYAGTATQRRATVSLGCDFAPGRTRRSQAAAGRRIRRFAALRRRGRKLAGIRKAVQGGKRARRLFTTGLLAAATHDAAVNGISDAEVMALRRTAALACSPRARGRSLALVTLMHGIPTWRAEVEVVLQYSRQVWTAAALGANKSPKGDYNLAQIAELWRGVDKEGIFTDERGEGRRCRRGPPDRHGGTRGADGSSGHAPQGQRGDKTRRRAEATWCTDGRRREWGRTRGPIGAVLLTLHRIGWSMSGPFTLVDDWGEEVILTKVTPSLLASMLREATARSLERYVGRKMALDDVTFDGRRACTEHIRKQLASDRKLTPQGKGAYMSVLCGAVMTYHKAAQGGYLVEDRCPLCGQKGDTIWHRVWECCHPQVADARRAAVPAWLIDEVARRPREHIFWTSGLLPHPGDTWPRPAANPTLDVEYRGDGDPPLREDGRPRISGTVYVDGSCTAHIITELKRASTSMVVMDGHGNAKWQVRMPVPTPMPQSSQAAEYAALPLVHAYAANTSDDFDIASDCLNVVKSCNEDPMKAIAASRMYGGIMKPILADTCWRANVKVRKVPAHVSPDAFPPGQGRSDAIGNQQADLAAKSAGGLHPAAAPALQQEVEAALKRARLVVRAIAAVMPVFPPMPAAQRMQRRPIPRDGAAITGAGGHTWKFAAGFWRCDTCWLMTLKPDLDAATVHRRCPGPKQELEATTIVRRGHTLGHIDGQMPILFCTACGSYSARRAYGLGAECRGTPTKAGAQALSRIRRGLQPWRNQRDAGGERPRLGTSRAWSGHHHGFVDGRLRSTRRRSDEHGATELPEDEHMHIDTPIVTHDDTVDEHRAHDLGDDGEGDYDVFGHGGALDQMHHLQQTPPNDRDRQKAGDHGNNAKAKGAAMDSTVGAREGPGGPCLACVTAATAPPSSEVAVAAVAARHVAVSLWTDDLAREAQAERGMTAYGPPGGNVAPPEGVGEEVTKRRRLNFSSHTAPTRLGVRPSNGHQLVSEDNSGPTGVERRRDGTDVPVALSTAAPSGEAAAVQCRREQPQRGWCHLYPRARQPECSGTSDEGGASHQVGDGRADSDASGSRECQAPHEDEGQRTVDNVAKKRRCENATGRELEADIVLRHARAEDDGGGQGLRAHGHARPHEVGGRDRHEDLREHRGPRDVGGQGRLFLDHPRGDCPRAGHRRQPCGADEGGTQGEASGADRRTDIPASSEYDGREHLVDGSSFDMSSSVTQWDAGAGCNNASAVTPAAQREHGGRPARRGRACTLAEPPGDHARADAPRGPPRRDAAPVDHGGRERSGGTGPPAAPRRGEADERPLWMRPPAWLYLPHLGCGGGADIPSAGENRDTGGPHDQRDEDHLPLDGEMRTRRAGGELIRGRAQPPGVRRQRDDGATGSIRGRASAPGHAGHRGGGAAALARHFAGLDQERAAKRARRGDHGQKDDVPTAAQRIAAIRQRLAARSCGASTGAAIGADSAGVARRSTNVDAKMHHDFFREDNGGGFEEAVGRPSPAAAADVARQAWHAAGTHPTAT